jgi:HAE1 family hydrophobic/amphiphilic exporter-1
MALGFGDGAEIRTPMAVTVIFGLIMSTFLTLLLIPTIYFLADRIKARFIYSTPQPGGEEHEEGTA